MKKLVMANLDDDHKEATDWTPFHDTATRETHCLVTFIDEVNKVVFPKNRSAE